MGHSGVAAGPGRSIAMSRIAAVRAPRGAALRCRGWHQEAALRMLHNNLDPEVAENPDELIVYGGTGPPLPGMHRGGRPRHAEKQSRSRARRDPRRADRPRRPGPRGARLVPP